MNFKSARLRLGAAITLYLIWVAALIAMAVYSAARPPERIIRHSSASAPEEPRQLDVE
jgi:hypothetical protein